ncbi:hypothetical protein OTU49_007705, partial [Cherax quadricarinatus]
GQDRNQSCQSSLPRNFRTLLIKMPRSRSRSKKKQSGKKWKESSKENNVEVSNTTISEVRTTAGVIYEVSTVGANSEVPPSPLPLSGQPGSPLETEALVTCKVDYNSSSEVSTSNAQLKQHLIEHHCSLVEEKAGLSTYEIKTKDLHKDEDHKIQVMTIGPENKEAINSVLLLGETGAGKTRAIDAMINFLFGVNFEDNFRFQLKDQVDSDDLLVVESQTEYVTAYIIYHQEGMPLQCNYMLIDTPGFGDTRENYEKIAIERMTHFLTNDYGIDDLNCVALVAKANQNRISAHHKQMLEEITSVLGSNIGDITQLLATFASDGTASVGDVMRHEEVPFVNIYQLDNMPLYVSRNDDSIGFIISCLQPRWASMVKEYDRFFKDLHKFSPVNVKQTRDLLMEKKLLEEVKRSLMRNVQYASALDNTVREDKDSLKDMKIELNGIKYIHLEERKETILEYSEDNYHFHNCKKCKKTCSKPHKNIGAGEIVGKACIAGISTAATAAPLTKKLGAPLAVSVVTAVCTGIASVAATACELGICSKFPLSGHCIKCGHRIAQHKREDAQYILMDKTEEVIDESLKYDYDTKAKEITQLEEEIQQKEKTLNQHRKDLWDDTKALVQHARKISSLRHRNLNPELLIDEFIMLEKEDVNIVHLLKKVKEEVAAMTRQQIGEEGSW